MDYAHHQVGFFIFAVHAAESLKKSLPKFFRFLLSKTFY